MKRAADSPIQWESSDPSVADVSGGLVRALKEGTAVITASASVGGETGQARCAVTVKGSDQPSVRILSVIEKNYRFQIPLDLEFENDEKILHRLLAKATPGGYPVAAEYYYQDLGTAALHDRITQMANLANENDYTVFMLGCHGWSGVPSGSRYEGSLVLTDGRDEEDMTLRSLIEDLNRIPGKVTVLLSSCGSGSVINVVESVDTRGKFTVLTSTVAGVDAHMESGYDEDGRELRASGYLLALEYAINQMTGDSLTDSQLMSRYKEHAESSSSGNPNYPQVYPVNDSVIFQKVQ